MTTPLDDAISRASRHAPFLRGLIRREEALLQCMHAQGFAAAFAEAGNRLDPERPFQSLREARGGVALTVALADLSGAFELEQTTEALSAFADRALNFAIVAAFAERDLAPGGLVALALGKQGSHELNFSSDLDLIFLHDPEQIATRGTDPTDTAVRIVRRVVALLSERTSDGYAFRVDLRLRPDPDSTPASLPVGAAESYYQSEALAWERSAFIRARPAAGDLPLGRAFLTAIRPFLWRRSLDYSALADIRDVTFRIRDHFEDRQTPGPGWDVKRGRGGIREIEFYAQAHQMIWGGRDERLRAPATLDALAALTEAGHVSQGDAMLLADSYRLFRRIEHRLQMVEDQQTHLVPKQKLAREAIAALDGAPDWKALESDLVHRSREVARLYDKLIAVGDDEGGPRGPRIPHAPDDVERWAAQARLADPALATSLIASWRRGRARSLRAPESRRAFEVVLPGLLTALGRGPGGREAMLRLDRMIGALPYGVQVWRLLKAHPELAETLARLLTATPWLADSLAARPQRLDVLLSPPPPLETIEDALAELHHAVRGLGEEAFLDRVRVWTHERQFHAAVSLLDGAASPLAVARLLSLLAEAAVVVLAEQVEAGFAARHGIVPESEFVALALGRFGGGELTFQSDLDLVFLFTGDWKASSDGIEPITASARWTRFATRLVAAQ
ncbi:MAG: glutamine-synthetase adenylyltransferase, partial [Thermaurantiacus sp.]